MNRQKRIPKFKTEAEEKVFWQKHDSTDYINWKQARIVQPGKLKPSTKSISIRLPETLLFEIQNLANREDVPYQSMMKILLSEAVKLHRNNS